LNNVAKFNFPRKLIWVMWQSSDMALMCLITWHLG